MSRYDRPIRPLSGHPSRQHAIAGFDDAHELDLLVAEAGDLRARQRFVAGRRPPRTARPRGVRARRANKSGWTMAAVAITVLALVALAGLWLGLS